jgi:dihydrofolate reductase
MGKLVVSEFVTLDGVAEAPDKWINGIHFKLFDEEGGKFKHDELFASEALLLGRVTYEAFAQAWPPRTGEFADRFNSIPKFVASRTLDKVDWNASLIKGNVAEEVARLKRQPGGDLVVHGSLSLVDTLMRHQLVDEYRVWIDPIVVGAGRRLFNEGVDPAVLKLVDTKTFPSGTVVLTYHPANGAPA